MYNRKANRGDNSNYVSTELSRSVLPYLNTMKCR